MASLIGLATLEGRSFGESEGPEVQMVGGLYMFSGLLSVEEASTPARLRAMSHT